MIDLPTKITLVEAFKAKMIDIRASKDIYIVIMQHGREEKSRSQSIHRSFLPLLCGCQKNTE